MDENQMDENQIVKSLSVTSKPRITIYLNAERVDEFYSQYVGAITELVRSRKLGSRLSASLAGLFGGDISAERGIAGNIKLSPVLKAILIESQGLELGEMVNVMIDPPKPLALLRYIGESSLVPPTIAVDTTIIQRERIRVEQGAKKNFGDEYAKTIVWLSSPKAKNRLASIGFLRNVSPRNFLSYNQQNHFGILGRLSRELEGITFISPFWIWYE